MGDLNILIFDDGSEFLCPFDPSSICCNARIFRFEQSVGYIARRNQLIQTIDSKYYLSLDDDSYPVSGSLAKAIEFAESRDDLFCLVFPVYNPRLSNHQLRSVYNYPYKVKSFIGCSHLLKRTLLLESQYYYREELVRFKEEIDLSVRMFLDNLYCYHYPYLKFHHSESSADRDWWTMDFYGARNTVLWNDWYVPSLLQPIRQTRSTISRILQFAKTRRAAHLQGHWNGFNSTRLYESNRQRMTLNQYIHWSNLPSL